MDSVPFVISGDRITGELTLPQTWPEGGDGVVEVSFDLEIPDELHPEC